MENRKSDEKIQELQILEHNMHNILAQKQAFQIELNECLNSLDEIKDTSDDIYKMTGTIMIKADKKRVSDELSEKKEILQLRLKALEKQEELFKSKAKELQNDIQKHPSKK